MPNSIDLVSAQIKDSTQLLYLNLHIAAREGLWPFNTVRTISLDKLIRPGHRLPTPTHLFTFNCFLPHGLPEKASLRRCSVTAKLWTNMKHRSG